MKDILVELSVTPKGNCIGINTFDSKYGDRGIFLVEQEMIFKMLNQHKEAHCYLMQGFNCLDIQHLDNGLRFQFSWLDLYGREKLKGFLQTIVIPEKKLRKLIESGEPTSLVIEKPMNRRMRFYDR